MLPALLTTLGFSFSVIFAAKSSRLIGGPAANLSRMTLAAVLLAIWAHTFGHGLQGAGLGWFFFSGVLGFGLGDTALFGALERIGPRLSILLTQCLAAPIAALAEYLWLGTTLSGREFMCSGVILAGVGLALAPDRGFEGDRKTFISGVIFGVLSAAGQALGAVVSRKASMIDHAAGLTLDGGTAAYQRILAGVAVTALTFLFVRKMRVSSGEVTAEKWRKAAPMIAGNALAGPAFGVACYQWALATTKSGIVMPIVATSPLVTMLLSWALDGQRPTRRAAIGGFLAVLGAAGLKYFAAGE